MARGSRDHSSTRRAILEATVRIIVEVGSEGVRVSDVARRASVGVPTVYYYFASRDALVAEAQVAHVEAVLASRRGHSVRWHAALEADDERAFYEAMRDYDLATVSSESRQRMWTLLTGLLDVRGNEIARRRFAELNDQALAEREAVMREAQRRGWLRSDVDTAAWIVLTASTVVGQVLVDGSDDYDIDPARWHALMWSLIGGRTWED